MCVAVQPLTDAQRALAASCVDLARQFAGRRRLAAVDPDDVLQETLLAVVDAARDYDPSLVNPHTGRPYAFTTFAHACLRRRRKPLLALARGNRQNRGRGGDPADDLDPHDPGEEDEALAWSPKRADVGELLAALPAVEAAVLGRRFGLADGVPMTAADVAADLGLPARVVADLERAAVGRLRELAGLDCEVPA